jgi:hypothetical protein
VQKLKPTAESGDSKPNQSRAASNATPSGAKKAVAGPERDFKPSGKAVDAIRGQLSKLWNIDTGRKNDGDLRVVVRVEVDRDGTVLNAVLDDASAARANTDRGYRAAAEAALRAITRAQKLSLLPEEFTAATYNNWRHFVFTFDPRDMF